MNWIDAVVAIVTAISVGWGIWRGLVREVLSILGWIVAFLAASLFAGPLSLRIEAWIASPVLRLVFAYGAIFLVALILVSLLSLVVSRIVRAAGLSGIDRSLGALFGLARAGLVVLALTLLAGFTSLPRETAWRESLCAPWLAIAARTLSPWLPQSLSSRLSYD